MVSKTDVLTVKTLGGFSLTWRGMPITGDARSTETQFIYLLQALFHSGSAGVSREQLFENLFSDREVKNAYHSLQSLLYIAKKKLSKAGLPDVPYIEARNGIYYWTSVIPIREDAAEFETLFDAAQKETDIRGRLRLYLDACFRYTGEFLPAQSGILWVSQEARRYRNMFHTCVDSAAELLRQENEYVRLEELGRHAARVEPFHNWEHLIMEAMVTLGRPSEAKQLYADTCCRYIQKIHASPSRDIEKWMLRLTEQNEPGGPLLDHIQSQLSEQHDQAPGGYLCSYPVFEGIYRMMQRISGQGGQSVYLMLCTAADQRGQPLPEGPALDALSDELERIIRLSVRSGDAVTGYGKGQFLILLINSTLEDCALVRQRIEAQLTGAAHTIQTYTAPVRFAEPEA